MIEENKRRYIKEWFDDSQKFEEGDFIVFDMPGFCSGDYNAKIYLSDKGEPYIKKSKDYSKRAVDIFIAKD